MLIGNVDTAGIGTMKARHKRPAKAGGSAITFKTTANLKQYDIVQIQGDKDYTFVVKDLVAIDDQYLRVTAQTVGAMNNFVDKPDFDYRFLIDKPIQLILNQDEINRINTESNYT